MVANDINYYKPLTRYLDDAETVEEHKSISSPKKILCMLSDLKKYWKSVERKFVVANSPGDH
jgi:hypothetical protein